MCRLTDPGREDVPMTMCEFLNQLRPQFPGVTAGLLRSAYHRRVLPKPRISASGAYVLTHADLVAARRYLATPKRGRRMQQVGASQ